MPITVLCHVGQHKKCDGAIRDGRSERSCTCRCHYVSAKINLARQLLEQGRAGWVKDD